ncbi:MAG: urea carboxylase-associated family protein [Gammaproteobacteria bacterium]
MQSISKDKLLYEDELPAGTHTSLLLRRGLVLRLTDLEGGANVSALLFNHEEKLERYNMPDTLKAQHTAFLTNGNVCYSDMGRILVSIIDDTCGWHDTVCGLSHTRDLAQRYGECRFQEHRNDMYRSGHDSLLIEIGKYGLGKRDLHAPINFFSKVNIAEDGALEFETGHSKAGNYVDLRAEIDVLIALSSAPHPLDPSATYSPKRTNLSVYRADPVATDDVCRVSCDQNRRGFINTERYAMR